jgi:tetratricopeptide (TPR) repeat protein
MELQELLERYEALGEERDSLAAKPLFEQGLAEGEDARLLNDYGYLLACHARRELRRAVELYERAIALDPCYDKPHYQLISARASLLEPDSAVRDYEARLAASPDGVREHRFLAQAYLSARAYARALDVAGAGLRLAPGDAALTAMRGDAKAGLGDPGGALADWRLALELEPEDIGALYSSAFLLEREGRVAEAAEAWEAIVAWNEARGFALQARFGRARSSNACAPSSPRHEATFSCSSSSLMANAIGSRRARPRRVRRCGGRGRAGARSGLRAA